MAGLMLRLSAIALQPLTPIFPQNLLFRFIDASGQYVTPGLVDLHTHIFYGIGYYGVHADTVAARSGVTTWLDVGSSGGYNFPGFREYIVTPAQARIYALINISSIGLTTRSGNSPTWITAISISAAK